MLVLAHLNKTGRGKEPLRQYIKVGGALGQTSGAMGYAGRGIRALLPTGRCQAG